MAEIEGSEKRQGLHLASFSSTAVETKRNSPAPNPKMHSKCESRANAWAESWAAGRGRPARSGGTALRSRPTLHTHQLTPHESRPPLFRQNPRPQRPGRIMPDVLHMPALQI